MHELAIKDCPKSAALKQLCTAVKAILGGTAADGNTQIFTISFLYKI